MPFIERIRLLADRLGTLSAESLTSELRAVDGFLQAHLLPHEASDETEIYPGLADIVGGADPMGTMSHTHREIAHLARLYHHLVADWLPQEAGEAELGELRRVLYALDAILRLHYAQEDELYETSASAAH